MEQDGAKYKIAQLGSGLDLLQIPVLCQKLIRSIVYPSKSAMNYLGLLHIPC